MRRKSTRFSQRALIESLESRVLMSVTINPLPDVYGEKVNVPAGKTLILPLSSESAGAVTYSVQAPKGWQVTVINPSDSVFINFHVKYGASGTEGDIVIQLLPNFAPDTVERIVDFVNDGAYDDTPFQRVIEDFIVQGGDFGDGVDPATIGDGEDDIGLDYADEFNSNAIFSGNGQLALVNSGKDSNGAQFFFTYWDPTHQGAAAPRFLDFNHTIFGQVVRGMDVLAEINAVPKVAVQSGQASEPVDEVTLMTATVITDQTDGSIIIKAPARVTGAVPLTITATDDLDSQESQSILVRSVASSVKDPPILGNVTNQYAAPGQPITIKMTSVDIDGGAVQYAVFAPPSPYAQPPAGVTGKVVGNTITIYPPDGVYTGTFPVQVGVRQVGATSRGSTLNPWDTEVIYLTWTTDSTPPTASAEAKPVYGPGVSSTFTVTYTSDKQIGLNSIINNNKAVNVTTPLGKTIAARYVGYVLSEDGKEAVVTYRVVGPGGYWDANDAGTYVVNLMSSAIKDAVGNSAAAGVLTEFTYSPTVAFDEEWYLQQHAAVVTAIANHQYTSGYQYYIKVGMANGDAPSIYFDEDYYLQNNPAVQTLITKKKVANAFTHFVRFGLPQVLNGSAAFDQQDYLDNHPDAVAQIAKKKYTSALDYYIRTGIV
jgi:cyclophilin family peptidyl-prolyl cis-trans isomerase